MLDLIKAIVESIKVLSLTDLLEARKNKKAHEIGTELFLMYATINDILVLGRRIVEERRTGGGLLMDGAETSRGQAGSLLR